ncbi:hypothetical protein JW949_00040 [Candidatus Woesearchaeota archaeon]|nr:hypothetical protein [Candidatus Woesearchaeota archaeon]
MNLDEEENKLRMANSELKRVEHMIYVSLKYTRTGDVIINIMKRMVDAYELIIDALLEHAQEKNKIDIIPITPKQKIKEVKTIFPDIEVRENIELYTLFKQSLKVKCERENEYRRHVTLRCIIKNEEFEFNIDNMNEFYLKAKNFLSLVIDIMKGKVDGFKIRKEEEE